jgi:heat shock protein HtpX
LMNGFERFLTAAPVVEAVTKHMDEELQNAKVDPYDTHPPLKERIAAVEHLPPGDGGSNDTPAITLIEDAAELEKVLLSMIIVPAPGVRFQPLEWSEFGTKVCMPPWKQLVNANARNLQGITIGNLSSTVVQRGMLLWVTAQGAPVVESNQNSFANAVIGAAIALALIELGWNLEVDPGAPVMVRNGEHSLKPFDVLDGLATKKIGAEDWERQCLQFGIGGIELAPPGTPAMAKAA